jgi:hypothetical protein
MNVENTVVDHEIPLINQIQLDPIVVENHPLKHAKLWFFIEFSTHYSNNTISAMLFAFSTLPYDGKHHFYHPVFRWIY